MQVNAEKDIRFFCGTSGSGKSYAIKQTIEQEKNILIFDPEGEYSDTGGKFKKANAYTSLGKIVREIEKNKNNFRLAYEANGAKAFDAFCHLAWDLATVYKIPIVVVADELAGVEQSIGKAQGKWFDLLTRGRKHGIKIRAGAQSPTEVSKTIMRQRSHLWVGHMTRQDDFNYIAKEIPVTAKQLSELRPAPFFDSVMHMQGKEPIINKK